MTSVLRARDSARSAASREREARRQANASEAGARIALARATLHSDPTSSLETLRDLTHYPDAAVLRARAKARGTARVAVRRAGTTSIALTPEGHVLVAGGDRELLDISADATANVALTTSLAEPAALACGRSECAYGVRDGMGYAVMSTSGRRVALSQQPRSLELTSDQTWILAVDGSLLHIKTNDPEVPRPTLTGVAAIARAGDTIVACLSNGDVFVSKHSASVGDAMLVRADFSCSPSTPMGPVSGGDVFAIVVGNDGYTRVHSDGTHAFVPHVVAAARGVEGSQRSSRKTVQPHTQIAPALTMMDSSTGLP
jgi:hypothetical protein